MRILQYYNTTYSFKTNVMHTRTHTHTPASFPSAPPPGVSMACVFPRASCTAASVQRASRAGTVTAAGRPRPAGGSAVDTGSAASLRPGSPSATVRQATPDPLVTPS
ncbi:hypothetical protein CRUP_015127 [Coryphaenoides rupestris]|nr:hypothetical protein CRUP_015127 [Coryphaenoides rupestris]